ncbi:hypothetical protein Y1Q_0020661 [Alligator mississippiensis]|uniref:Uncharacterized protein n=1 Tax=Alligator mississippiensis TaxID=8496 RepID=A0A151NH61_ALLMI|nr:hypothetical protein Y1Q_0020661 [Alligator mississippiensis]
MNLMSKHMLPHEIKEKEQSHLIWPVKNGYTSSFLQEPLKALTCSQFPTLPGLEQRHKISSVTCGAACEAPTIGTDSEGHQNDNSHGVYAITAATTAAACVWRDFTEMSAGCTIPCTERSSLLGKRYKIPSQIISKQPQGGK